MGPGNEQYSYGDTQQFEEMSPAEIIQMAREEVQDLVVYAVMADIQLMRMMRGLERLDSLGEVNPYAE